MKFKLLPYSESKHLEGSEDAPIYHDGEFWHNHKPSQWDGRVVLYDSSEIAYRTDDKNCHQLCIEEDCKACKVKRLNQGLRTGNYNVPCDCTNGKTYKLYTGDDVEQIVKELQRI